MPSAAGIFLARALRMKTPRAGSKVTLIAIASLANEEGVAWISTRELALMTNVGRAQIARNIRQLLRAGYVRNAGRDPKRKRRRAWRITERVA